MRTVLRRRRRRNRHRRAADRLSRWRDATVAVVFLVAAVAAVGVLAYVYSRG